MCMRRFVLVAELSFVPAGQCAQAQRPPTWALCVNAGESPAARGSLLRAAFYKHSAASPFDNYVIQRWRRLLEYDVLIDPPQPPTGGGVDFQQFAELDSLFKF